ncbi:MAG: hypothetical protein AABW45_01200 [Nanoarchaeota archaeon]
MKSRKPKDEFKAIIPANVDPIKLADEIKRGMSTRFLREMKRLRQRRIKSRLAQQS